eukprot:TRINITY_DN90954_c0_g1_i1.p1 TRINITY_DN90954_c0_g1~~TRINITY_DN90954_c0_g1_i1.p1  ORF type:complete len:215 (-),score=45.95 TRINITY_DN90954_c0_g1_i1:108-752(-)
MYGLRKINNMYEGGTRSDFVVVGHPEYQMGAVRAARGYDAKWDTTPIPMLPAKSVAKDRLRQSGSAQLLQRLRAPLEDPPTRERAQGRSAKEYANSRKALAGDLRADFDRFIAAMKSEALPTYQGGDRITSGAGNHLADAGACRHYKIVNDELADLAARLKRQPEVTEYELLATDSWRYYALRLEQARRRGIQSAAQQERVRQQVMRASSAAAL